VSKLELIPGAEFYTDLFQNRYSDYSSLIFHPSGCFFLKKGSYPQTRTRLLSLLFLYRSLVKQQAAGKVTDPDEPRSSGLQKPSGEKQRRQQIFFAGKMTFFLRRCGQAPAYPQDEMWENPAFVHRRFFIPKPCALDTGFMQTVFATASG
jgi:hypothetical protein